MAAIFTGQSSTFSLKREAYPNVYTSTASCTALKSQALYFELSDKTSKRSRTAAMKQINKQFNNPLKTFRWPLRAKCSLYILKHNC